MHLGSSNQPSVFDRLRGLKLQRRQANKKYHQPNNNDRETSLTEATNNTIAHNLKKEYLDTLKIKEELLKSDPKFQNEYQKFNTMFQV